MPTIIIQGEDEKKRGISYRLDSSAEPIGIGGMGKVYEGVCLNEQTGQSRPVAIKFLYNDLPPQAIAKGRREASVQLRNDNLVEMLGFIEQKETDNLGEDHSYYHVVSELLNGVSLSDIFAGKCEGRDGKVIEFALKMRQQLEKDPKLFARTVAINVLSGLMALHDAGFIHRDIDPSNIMFTDDGHIKLIDFGLVKNIKQSSKEEEFRTVAGTFIGKPEYAAPELVLGDVDHQNPTTDIYAVGVLLYQCLTGKLPFNGARYEVLEKQLREKIPLKLVKSSKLRKIISIACEKKQDLRYQTAAQMRAALEGVIDEPSTKSSLFYLVIGVLGIIIGGILGFIF